MAWEERRNGRRYYYRKHWRDGTCQSEYVGGGPLAEAFAIVGAIDAGQRAFDRDVKRAEIETETEIDRRVDEFITLVRVLRNAVLLASGYHSHKGQWRKARRNERTN